jgi:hypothetical protein
VPSDRSFTNYIKNRFYDSIYPAVDDFVEQNWEGFDQRISNVRCAGDLACDLDDFQIIGVAAHQKNEMPNPLSDPLVPYIYKKDLEKEALKFLERYHPEALKTPMAVEPSKLAEQMWLQREQSGHSLT